MAESPSIIHNRDLATDFIAKSGVLSRYPKVSEQVECLPLDSARLPAFSYNPSIYRKEGRLWMTYRYHYEANFKTRIGIAEIKENGEVLKSQDIPLSNDSCEDARLFTLHVEPWMSWVEARFTDGHYAATSVVKYGKLSSDWKITTVHQPARHANDGNYMQKNWCFFESDENLFCVYRSWPEQIIFHVQGDSVVSEYKSPGVKWPYGETRGGNIVPYKDKLLHVFHSSTQQGIGQREQRYYVGACLMEPKPPFSVLAVIKKPIIYGSEVDNLTPEQRASCRQWKSNVVFPCGLLTEGEGWILACGINDSACALVKIKDLNL